MGNQIQKDTIHDLVLRNQHAIIEKNLDQLDLNHLNQEGQSPLYVALYQSDFRMVKLLLDNKAQIIPPFKYNKTLLHFAVCQEKLQLLQYVLVNYPELKDVKDQFGLTAVHMAFAKKSFKILKILIQHDCDPTINDNKGSSLIDYFNRTQNQSENTIETLNKTVETVPVDGFGIGLPKHLYKRRRQISGYDFISRR